MSTSDRELLELAAKAAEYKVRPMLKPLFRYEQNGNGESERVPNGNTPVLMMGRKEWNPLTDDGDALRLAVKLGLDIAFYNGYQEVHAESASGDQLSPAIEEYGEDRFSATRRAIVRAAAEIGRSME